MRHEERRAEVGAFTDKVKAQSFLCRIVCPDEVARAVVVFKTFLGVEVEVDAEFLVYTVSVTQPRVMVAVDHHYHRLIQLFQLLFELDQLLTGFFDAAQIVI